MRECDIYIHGIANGSMVDGPGGPRTVVWLAGCSIRCPGCQNFMLWERHVDQRTSIGHAVRRVRQRAANGGPITITGGEPFDQTRALWRLIANIRLEDLRDGLPRRHIIVYTGYTWRQLVERAWTTEAPIGAILSRIDILVDGPYIAALDNDSLQWRGSANQRAIDTLATMETCGAGLLVPDKLVVLDWDAAQEFQIVDGKIIGTGAGLAGLGLTGTEVNRCGEAT